MKRKRKVKQALIKLNKLEIETLLRLIDDFAVEATTTVTQVVESHPPDVTWGQLDPETRALMRGLGIASEYAVSAGKKLKKAHRLARMGERVI